MSSKVIFNTSAFYAKTTKAKRRAEMAIADQIIADSRQFVPDDGEHTLRDSARIELDGDGTKVTYNTPYAAYQYYGCYPDGSHQIANHTTAGTTTQWIEHAKDINAENWHRVGVNAFKELG